MGSGKWGFRKGQAKHETPSPKPTKRPYLHKAPSLTTTPDPIPNSEVKLFCVDGTARVTVWESRTSPAFFYELPPLPPIHEWRGGLKFFSSETKKWEVGSGVLGKARLNTPPPQKPGPNTKRQHQNLPKGLTFTRLQASPPHEMRKGRAAKPRAPFAFRGAWGDFVPPQKKSHFGGLVPPHTKKLCRDRAWRGWSRVAVISL